MGLHAMSEQVISLLLGQLHRAFDRRSWHGTNLMGSLRGLDLRLVIWRPQSERHNIAELVVHAAYWKYRVYRLLTDDDPRSFELAGYHAGQIQPIKRLYADRGESDGLS